MAKSIEKDKEIQEMEDYINKASKDKTPRDEGKKKKVVTPAPKEEKVELLPLIPKTMKVKIVGDTPLLAHNFGATAQASILDKQTHKAVKREKRDIDNEVKEATYKTEDGKDGFPASGFKKGMVEVAPYLPNLDKKRIRGSVQIIGNIVPLKYKSKVVNQATVRINRGLSGDIRFRPEYREWSCELMIRFNESLISAEQVINLLNYAGFQIGVGDWRPDKNGSFGMYHVETA